MKHILFLSLFLMFGQTFGQFVTIPDPNFKIWFKNNYPQCLNASDQMDTTCSEIVSETYISSLNSKAIENLDGIQYFDNLDYLNCGTNKLYYFPKLPQKLTTIRFQNNFFTSFPELPATVVFVEANDNCFDSEPINPNPLLITTFTTLPLKTNCTPASAPIPDLNLRKVLIEKLPSCFNSNETMRKTCVNGIINLDISNKNISDLEGLQYFINLKELNCSNNQLSSIYSLPTNLEKLDCSHNNLNDLSELPSKLIQLKANLNCFPKLPQNSNPRILTSFEVLPNKKGCGKSSFAIEINPNTYLATYQLDNGEIDYGINTYEVRCGYGIGLSELANIQDSYSDFLKFTDYPQNNVKYGIVSAHSPTKYVYYNSINYHQGDTIRFKNPIWKFSSDPRNLDGIDPYPMNFTGSSEFYIQYNSPLKDMALYLCTTSATVAKDTEYRSAYIDRYEDFVPIKTNSNNAMVNLKTLVMGDFKLYYQDTTYRLEFISSYTCDFNRDPLVPDLQQFVKYSNSNLDSISFKLIGGNSFVKKAKLIGAFREAQLPAGMDKVLDSTINLTNKTIKLRNINNLISKQISKLGDTLRFRLELEIDTTLKPIFVNIDSLTLYASSIRSQYTSEDTLIKSTLYQTSIIYPESKNVFCGNYKPVALIKGDTLTCLNKSVKYTTVINPNDNSISYTWKYGIQSTNASSFNVNFSTAGTQNLELKLVSACGTHKQTKSISTINGPTKPIVSQQSNVFSSSATTGNQWYKDGSMIQGATNKTYTATSNGTFYVTATNICGSSASNSVTLNVLGTENEVAQKDVFVYPNPATSEIFVQGLANDYQIELFDLNGQKVLDNTIQNHKSLNISELPKGVYLLKLYDEQKNQKLNTTFVKN